MSYPGGKAKTFHQIINVIPPHNVYIEPFLGKGSVLRAKRPARIEIGVDLDARCIEPGLFAPRAVQLMHGDGIEFLQTYPFQGHEVVYCDPPYLPETRKRARVYQWDLSCEDHIRLLNVLKSLSARVIVSGYDSRLYQHMLRGWSTRAYTAKAHDGLRREFLWFNYDPPSELHDYRYLGANFRERENISRRISRLKHRIGQLSAQEQALIRDWLCDEVNHHAN